MKLFAPKKQTWRTSRRQSQKVTNLFIFAMFVVALALTQIRPTTPTGITTTATPAPPPSRTRSQDSQVYYQVSVRLDQNQDQPAARYDDLSRDAGYSLFVTTQELAISLQKSANYRYIDYSDQIISAY